MCERPTLFEIWWPLHCTALHCTALHSNIFCGPDGGPSARPAPQGWQLLHGMLPTLAQCVNPVCVAVSWQLSTRPCTKACTEWERSPWLRWTASHTPCCRSEERCWIAQHLHSPHRRAWPGSMCPTTWKAQPCPHIQVHPALLNRAGTGAHLH